MSEVLYDTKNYTVIETDNALGEDGNLGAAGYAVVNKATEVVEHTTVILPQAIYQAQGFSDSLDALMKDDDAPAPLSLVDIPADEDVVIN